MSKGVKEYFGNSVIIMSGNNEKDIHLIVDILNYPEKYRRTIDVHMIKKVSLLHNLDTIFA